MLMSARGPVPLSRGPRLLQPQDGLPDRFPFYPPECPVRDRAPRSPSAPGILSRASFWSVRMRLWLFVRAWAGLSGGNVKEHRIIRLRWTGVAATISRPPGEAREVLRQSRFAPLIEGRMGGRSALVYFSGGLPAAHARW